MMRKMEYGSDLKFQIQHTKDHGNARCLNLHIESWNSTLLSFFLTTGMHVILQKIKNPNYKGKWKTPWIDNPGTFLFFISSWWLDSIRHLRLNYSDTVCTVCCFWAQYACIFSFHYHKIIAHRQTCCSYYYPNHLNISIFTLVLVQSYCYNQVFHCKCCYHH